ncbi:MAG TPA: GNAT family N-acetyltransferase [Fimbriimonadaceae bacterium]|nr:GNAT family N-acetyltransferase [Fimbriimonadaceae bacterium]
MSPVVRFATADDFPSLAEVQRKSVDACLRPLYDSGAIDLWIERLTPTKFEKVVSTGEAVFCAVADGRVVGFSSCHPELCVLGMWYVDPDWIGKGIGTLLLARAEAHLASAGCKVATTEASLFAEPRFVALGWSIVEQVEKRAFGGTMRVIRMEKVLSPSS